MLTKRKTVRKKVIRKKAPARKKALARKRVKKKTDKTIIFMKGSNMAKKRKRRKSPVKRTYRKRKISSSRRRYYGASPRIKTGGIMGILMQGLGITGGAVGGSMVARLVPIKDLRIKSIIPILLGIGIMSMKQGKKGLVKDAALGSTAIGLISLLKTMAPNIPLLAADESELALLGMADELLEEEAAMLGLPVDGEDYDDLDGEDYDDLDGDEDDLETADFYGLPMDGEGASPADF